MTSVTLSGACYRCGDPNHWADLCPHNERAATKKEHEARIAGYVQRWTDGEILSREKQQMISEENKLWHGDKCRPAITI